MLRIGDNVILWSSVPVEQFRLNSWNGEDGLAVLYNIQSGDTHLVEGFAMTLLGLIRESPLSIEALSGQLIDSVFEPDHAKVQEFISATLLQLKDIGLVTDAAR